MHAHVLKDRHLHDGDEKEDDLENPEKWKQHVDTRQSKSHDCVLVDKFALQTLQIVDEEQFSAYFLRDETKDQRQDRPS